MYNQIVYGSLLHTEELKKQGIDSSRIELVKVSGYKRVFNQLPSWRKANDNKKAVMNIEKNIGAWFNAILIKNLNQEYIDELDIRERGYDRVSLNDGDVTIYKNGQVVTNCIVYKGKAGKQSDDILPNSEYFQICKDGAASHGREFLEDYMKTTYQNTLDGSLKLI